MFDVLYLTFDELYNISHIFTLLLSIVAEMDYQYVVYTARCVLYRCMHYQAFICVWILRAGM